VLDPPVSRYMTSTPWTIAPETTLAEAHRLMHRRAIRHLPVLRGERVVGLVSDRDVHGCGPAPGFDLDLVTVEEVMQREVLAVDPRTPLGDVVDRMAGRRAGSVVVVDGEDLVGIFTTTDALRSLAEIIRLVA